MPLRDMTPDKAVRTAKEMKAHKRLPDPGKEGLWLSIGKTGTVRWEARVRVAAVGGAPRWIGLGRYPGDAGLAVARHRCDAVRVAARAGADLHTLRRMFETPPTPPEPSPSSPTDPARDSLAAKVKIYERQGDPGKSWPHRRKRIDRVFKAQLLQSVNALTTVALQEAADTYPARQSAAFAVRTLRPALRWLAKRQHCPAELAAIAAGHRAEARAALEPGGTRGRTAGAQRRSGGARPVPAVHPVDGLPAERSAGSPLA